MGFVRQHWAANDVTNCPNTRQVGLQCPSTDNETTLIKLQANRFRIQTIGIWHDRSKRLDGGINFCALPSLSV